MSQPNAAPDRTGDVFFRPRRIAHANLFVSDYEKAADFYRSVVGFHEAYRQPDNLASFLSNGNTYHDLALTDLRSKYAPRDQKPQLWHLAFEVETEADLVDGYERSRRAGVEYAFVADHDVAHSLYKYDPDGNLVEIYADVVRDWESVRHGIIIKEKPQWIPGVTNAPSTERNYPQDPTFKLIQDAVFHPKRITHVGMVAKDYPGMLAYYTDIVGLVPVAGSASSAYAILRGTVGSCDITLFRGWTGVEPGLHHVGFEVWDEKDLDASLAKARSRGMAIDFDVAHPARRCVGIRDQDGLRLHFHVDREWTPGNVAALDELMALRLL